jgi:hypothetical protein
MDNKYSKVISEQITGPFVIADGTYTMTDYEKKIGQHIAQIDNHIDDLYKRYGEISDIQLQVSTTGWEEGYQELYLSYRAPMSNKERQAFDKQEAKRLGREQKAKEDKEKEERKTLKALLEKYPNVKVKEAK